MRGRGEVWGGEGRNGMCARPVRVVVSDKGSMKGVKRVTGPGADMLISTVARMQYLRVKFEGFRSNAFRVHCILLIVIWSLSDVSLAFIRVGLISFG